MHATGVSDRGLGRGTIFRFRWMVLCAVSGLFVGATVSAAACVGDCDSSGEVTVNELVTMVNIDLGYAMLSDCTAGDADGSGDIAVNEIIAAVNNVLTSCPTPPPTSTPAPTSTATETPTPTATSVTHTVVVGPGGSLTFSPSSLTIHVGDTVQWTWASSGHSVVSGGDCSADDQFCSPGDANCVQTPLSTKGATYSHTFTAEGTYPYYCSPHCSFGMVGTITVEPTFAPQP